MAVNEVLSVAGGNLRFSLSHTVVRSVLVGSLQVGFLICCLTNQTHTLHSQKIMKAALPLLSHLKREITPNSD